MNSNVNKSMTDSKSLTEIFIELNIGTRYSFSFIILSSGITPIILSVSITKSKNVKTVTGPTVLSSAIGMFNS